VKCFLYNDREIWNGWRWDDEILKRNIRDHQQSSYKLTPSSSIQLLEKCISVSSQENKIYTAHMKIDRDKNKKAYKFYVALYIIKPVYNGYWREPENVSIMSSCPLYRGSNYMHYSLNGENVIVLYRQWFVI
jgi:hypothetical protein